jgi:uncharacterized protein
MTVFIPCGVTQAMMAAALGTGNQASGAALMFAFTLGTSPVFFAVAYLTMELGARLEKFFMHFVAIVVLILGLVTLNSGLTLMGSPISFASLTGGIFAASEKASDPPEAPSSGDGALQLKVANNGYFPKTLYAKANQPITLDLVTNNTVSCARDFVIPALDVYELLPQSGRVSVAIPAQEAGTVLRFTCSMGMYTGQIEFGN